MANIRTRRAPKFRQASAEGSDPGCGAFDGWFHAACKDKWSGGSYSAIARKRSGKRGVDVRAMAANQVVQSAPKHYVPDVGVV